MDMQQAPSGETCLAQGGIAIRLGVCIAKSRYLGLVLLSFFLPAVVEARPQTVEHVPAHDAVQLGHSVGPLRQA
jgi:hypothetical protein